MPFVLLPRPSDKEYMQEEVFSDTSLNSFFESLYSLKDFMTTAVA